MVDDRNHLPSTPRSVQEAYTSMQPLIRHNASTPYRQNGYGPGGTYVDGYSSGHSTAYGSPVSNHWLADEYSGELHGHSYRPVPIHVSDNQNASAGARADGRQRIGMDQIMDLLIQIRITLVEP